MSYALVFPAVGLVLLFLLPFGSIPVTGTGDLNVTDTNADLNWAALNIVVPWADVNVANNITVDWTGLQTYPTGCSAGQAVQVIGDTLTCISVGGASGDLNWNALNAVIPWADVNVANNITASNYLANSYLGNLFPVPDVNILNAARFLQDSSCDNNTTCTITGKINTLIDGNYADINTSSQIIMRQDPTQRGIIINKINSNTPAANWASIEIDTTQGASGNIISIFDNNTNKYWAVQGHIFETDLPTWIQNDINFTGTLSGGDFNYGLFDANDSQSCPAGQALQSVGNSTSCISTSGDLNWVALNKVVPWADVNVADDITANKYLANAYLGNLFPVPDINILNAVRFLQDSSCDNNSLCDLLSSTIVWDSNDVLDERYVNVTGDTMTGTLNTRNLVPDLNDARRFGSLNVPYQSGFVYDLTVLRSQKSWDLNVDTDLNVWNNLMVDNNVYLGDGNVLFNGVGKGTWFGTPAAPFGKFYSNQGFTLTQTGGAAARISPNSYFGAIDVQPTSGIYFDNVTPKSIDLHILGIDKHTFYMGAAQDEGAFLHAPRTTDPTAATIGGTMYIKDTQTPEGNSLYINRGSSGSPDWRRVGDSLFGVIATAGTSGVTACNGFDGNWASGMDWTAVAATTTAGVPVSINDTTGTRNVMCRN